MTSCLSVVIVWLLNRLRQRAAWIVYVIVTRSIAVLPVNWATMAVRSIDHKSAFKMNFNPLMHTGHICDPTSNPPTGPHNGVTHINAYM